MLPSNAISKINKYNNWCNSFKTILSLLRNGIKSFPNIAMGHNKINKKKKSIKNVAFVYSLAISISFLPISLPTNVVDAIDIP